MKILEQLFEQKAGLPPGTLIHVGKQKTDKVYLRLCEYDEADFSEKEITDLDALQGKSQYITWLNIDGLHDVEFVKRVGESYQIHPLVQEDIVNTLQRPKVEEYDDFIYAVLKAFHYNEQKNKIDAEHVSLILSDHFVLSFQEKPEDVFKPVLERLSNTKSRIRRMKADYLFYTLIDSIVDRYFIVAERLSEAIEDLQERLNENPEETLLSEIYDMRKDISYMLRNLFPTRELIQRLLRLDFDLLSEEIAPYLRDVLDHVLHVTESLESERDHLTSMIEMYRSAVAQKNNDVMKVLTIIATIFMPLTFIVGVYGMNFKFMPELEWKWGYPFIWGILIGVGLATAFYFKRKKWL